MARRLLAAFAAAAMASMAPGGALGADLQALKADVERIAKATGGTLGVGVRHVETGEELYFNRTGRFPMGSLFKVPLAVEVLARVEQGALSLDKSIAILPGDLRPGSGKLKNVFGGPQPMTVRQLLDTMLVDSDNTATDLLWKEAGGAPAVTARLAALGVKGLQVARPTGELLAAASGLSREGRAAFLADERDTTTPQAYVALLDSIWRSKALGAQQTAHLLDVMKRCATGKARLRAGLPGGTLLAHKTGTLRPLVTNDAGIVALPGGRGHLLIVVLVRGSPRDLAAQERAIADVAKAAYARFSE